MTTWPRPRPGSGSAPADPAGPPARHDGSMTSIEVSGPPVDRSEEVLTPRGAGVRGGPAAAVRRPPRRAARRAPYPPGADRGRRAAGVPGLHRRDPRAATGRSPRHRATCATAGSRSPARPAARWRSTRSTPAPASGSPTSRTPTPRTGATSSRARSTWTTPSRRTIAFTSPEGKGYALDDPDHLPVILPRPRGWHLDEAHLTLDGQPLVGALVDFGLYFFHNAAEQLSRGSGPYFYLPKMESPPRGAALERRVLLRPAGAGDPAGLGTRDGADRDDHRGVRDGGDPLGAARPRQRAERRPLGLPVQHHQELPRRRRVHPPRPQRDHHEARR